MKHVSSIALVTLLACAHSAPRPPALGPVERKESWFVTNDRAVRADLLHLGAGGPTCLLRISGSASEFDDHVFPCTVRRNLEEGWVGYSIMWDGSSRTMLVQGRYPELRLGTSDGFRVTADEARATTLDTAPMLATYQAEVASGVLAKLMNFDRAAMVSRDAEVLKTARARYEKECGLPLSVETDTAKANDEALQALRVDLHCGTVIDAMWELCRSPAAVDFFKEQVSHVRCLHGDPQATEAKLSTFALANRTLTFTSHYSLNLATAAQAFFLNQGASQARAGVTNAPWHDGSSLSDRMVLDTMLVCGDDAGRTVVLGPYAPVTTQDLLDRNLLLSGTRTELTETRALGNGSVNPGGGLGFRDARHGPTPREGKFTGVVLASEDGKSCTVLCGPRTVKVPLLDRAAARKVLLEAKRSPSPFTRKPHALLRDATGAYYYVDTSTEPGREKDFRVFVGQRGQMKQLAMTNTLSDSEGQLFSTKSGELRLMLDLKQPSYWLAGKKKLELRYVPVEENLDVIFVDLGVYAGQRLGNPCDDF